MFPGIPALQLEQLGVECYIEYPGEKNNVSLTANNYK